MRAHFSLLKPAGFRVFSQLAGHYLCRESKSAIIYAHSKVIRLTGKRKPQSMTDGGPGSDHVVCHGLLRGSALATITTLSQGALAQIGYVILPLHKCVCGASHKELREVRQTAGFTEPPTATGKAKIKSLPRSPNSFGKAESS